MSTFLISRLLQGVLVLFGVSLFSFLFIFLSGDPVAGLAQPDWTQEQVEDLRRELGFDRPVWIQYLDYLQRVVRGDFGNSYRQHQPVFRLLSERLPATLELALAGFLLSLVVGVPIGVVSAVKRDTLVDQGAMFAALLAQAMPTFWLGIMLILVVGVELRWLPISGRGTLAHIILPALTLATYSMARNARLVRSSLLDVLHQDYVRTAHAKGLTGTIVIYKHALRNALVPVVTVMGLDFGSLLSGAVITEIVFAWPGLGRLIVNAVSSRDLPLVQGSVLLVGSFFVLINLLVDMSYAVLNPRVRHD
ncbi:MAG: ABC transporter permease [Truepera sp.]|nr:ABC transporter permease [Truepera sp.]